MKGSHIKLRIKAVLNTEKITKAMQLVAASKMKRAQEAARKSRQYSLLLAEILESLISRAEDLESPLLLERPVKHRGILVVSTDKGLCGPLNTNLFRKLLDVAEPTKYVSIGRKAKQFLSRTKKDLMADFTVSDKVHFAEVRVAIEFMLKAYMNEEIDTIEILFPQFQSTLTQVPALEKVAPLMSLKDELASLRKRLGAPKKAIDEDMGRVMLFEPSAEEMLPQLAEMFMKQQVYQMVLEAKASEHSARMVSMKNATDNAKSLAHDLKLEYNKARQAAITQEILEIAAASSAA